MKLRNLLFVLFILSLFPPVSLCAQDEEGKGNRLAGVWQQIVSVNQSAGSIVYRPFFKILNADGTFCNLQLMGGQERAFFSHEGSYSVLSDSVYVEHIEKSPYREYKGMESQQKYRLAEGDTDFLFIQNKHPKTGIWTSELWVRVKSPEIEAKPEEKEIQL